MLTIITRFEKPHNIIIAFSFKKISLQWLTTQNWRNHTSYTRSGHLWNIFCGVKLNLTGHSMIWTISKEEGRREKNHNQIISTAKNEILLSIKFSFFIYQSKTYSSHLEQTHELMKRKSIYFWYIYICTIANYWTVTLNSGLPLKEPIRLTSTLSSINSWYPVW